MHVIQSALSSARTNRLIFWVGALLLAAGVVVLVVKLAGGSDKTAIAPDKGFKPTLPTKAQPLKDTNGEVITKYAQLDPQVKQTIRKFIMLAVARENVGATWNIVAPGMKRGYTYAMWKSAKSLPIVPYPVRSVDDASYDLREADSQGILVDVGVTSKANEQKPATFEIGLVPARKGDASRWLVNYWMPRWQPLVPKN